MADQQLTTREKRQAKIAQLEARLQKEKARMNADKRKERNGQLIAFGIYLEEFLKAFPEQRQSIKNSMKKHLTGRNLERALAGWERITEKASHQTEEGKKKNLKNK